MSSGPDSFVAQEVARFERSCAHEISVSVVIPVKDDAVALERCLELLAQQSVTPLEIVVVDNGSTDTSAAVANRYGARVVTEPSPGIPAAAATGYDAARGDVIARCDADSVMAEDWVERIARCMTINPGVDALTGDGWFYDAPRNLGWVLKPIYLGTYYVLVHAALGHTTVWGSNMALRRRVWQEVRDSVHRDDPEVHDDIDLAFALGPERRVRYDGCLVVGVSARSVRGRHQLRRRFRRAFRTLRLNWRVTPPWSRWRTRLTAGRNSVE
ncbi:MAG: glycosyltransferase family 2 protein [Nocardioidaceae bacterium]